MLWQSFFSGFIFFRFFFKNSFTSCQWNDPISSLSKWEMTDSCVIRVPTELVWFSSSMCCQMQKCCRFTLFDEIKHITYLNWVVAAVIQSNCQVAVKSIRYSVRLQLNSTNTQLLELSTKTEQSSEYNCHSITNTVDGLHKICTKTMSIIYPHSWRPHSIRSFLSLK